MRYPKLDEAVEWRTGIWSPAVRSALDHASRLLSKDAVVLEVGYNSGMMACHMAGKYGWNVVGYDVSSDANEKAISNARRYGLEGKIEFRLCRPEDTTDISGSYDAVFLKSVLYHISEKSEYNRWLDWINRVLVDEGVVMAVENGRGSIIDRLYRKIVKRSRWADFMLFDRWTESEFVRRFRSVNVRYYGRLSQYLTYQSHVFSLIRSLEEKHFPASSDHCFVASVVAQK